MIPNFSEHEYYFGTQIIFFLGVNEDNKENWDEGNKP